MALRFPLILAALFVLVPPALGKEVLVREYLATASLEGYPQVTVEEIVPNLTYPLARTSFTLRQSLVARTIQRIYRTHLNRDASAGEIAHWKKELHKLRIGAVEGPDVLTLSLRYRQENGAAPGVYFLTVDGERLERVIARQVVAYLAFRIVRRAQLALR